MIAWGHRLETIWSYTPKQAAAWLELGRARRRAEMGEELFIAATGAQGSAEKITKQLRDWDEG